MRRIFSTLKHPVKIAVRFLRTERPIEMAAKDWFKSNPEEKAFSVQMAVMVVTYMDPRIFVCVRASQACKNHGYYQLHHVE
ncbi:hypothetical protein EYC80_002361 [Monilinia laxa]|uniref:Uncharacterized protein n=1 Tax=Monilinia laxa TaxID=61186 RepID=A0A5N6K495_MONLA|nr:hypothetical protein EYC80_002361 [Monilinia laxa]